MDEPQAEDTAQLQSSKGTFWRRATCASMHPCARCLLTWLVHLEIVAEPLFPSVSIGVMDELPAGILHHHDGSETSTQKRARLSSPCLYLSLHWASWTETSVVPELDKPDELGDSHVQEEQHVLSLFLFHLACVGA